MTEIHDSINSYLETNLDRFIGETIRLCAQPSVSARNEGVRECADVVVDLFKQHGLQLSATGCCSPAA
jgi:hypothetical protein